MSAEVMEQSFTLVVPRMGEPVRFSGKLLLGAPAEAAARDVVVVGAVAALREFKAFCGKQDSVRVGGGATVAHLCEALFQFLGQVGTPALSLTLQELGPSWAVSGDALAGMGMDPAAPAPEGMAQKMEADLRAAVSDQMEVLRRRAEQGEVPGVQSVPPPLTDKELKNMPREAVEAYHAKRKAAFELTKTVARAEDVRSALQDTLSEPYVCGACSSPGKALVMHDRGEPCPRSPEQRQVTSNVLPMHPAMKRRVEQELAPMPGQVGHSETLVCNKCGGFNKGAERPHELCGGTFIRATFVPGSA